jgi:hypothetical protein
MKKQGKFGQFVSGGWVQNKYCKRFAEAINRQLYPERAEEQQKTEQVAQAQEAAQTEHAVQTQQDDKNVQGSKVEVDVETKHVDKVEQGHRFYKRTERNRITKTKKLAKTNNLRRQQKMTEPKLMEKIIKLTGKPALIPTIVDLQKSAKPILSVLDQQSTAMMNDIDLSQVLGMLVVTNSRAIQRSKGQKTKAKKRVGEARRKGAEAKNLPKKVGAQQSQPVNIDQEASKKIQEFETTAAPAPAGPEVNDIPKYSERKDPYAFPSTAPQSRSSFETSSAERKTGRAPKEELPGSSKLPGESHSQKETAGETIPFASNCEPHSSASPSEAHSN